MGTNCVAVSSRWSILRRMFSSLALFSSQALACLDITCSCTVLISFSRCSKESSVKISALLLPVSFYAGYDGDRYLHLSCCNYHCHNLHLRWYCSSKLLKIISVRSTPMEIPVLVTGQVTAASLSQRSSIFGNPVLVRVYKCATFQNFKSGAFSEGLIASDPIA